MDNVIKLLLVLSGVLTLMIGGIVYAVLIATPDLKVSAKPVDAAVKSVDVAVKAGGAAPPHAEAGRLLAAALPHEHPARLRNAVYTSGLAQGPDAGAAH